MADAKLENAFLPKQKRIRTYLTLVSSSCGEIIIPYCGHGIKNDLRFWVTVNHIVRDGLKPVPYGI